ncbi:nuclear distribution protein nudE [Verticillium alfalfae VaMs.102]|uniref:Nuclear distribution protein nudE n=2 Tax=Verticillium TaxID=1036719 RepID=C9SEQ2_VERA1|nr:nuclear distribution protein nudE [Verticillium alfalfae VaMs.102]EEY16645.1 nuclear distribution protein nudE [Verticillium alfalfae VaMs.102]
MAEPPSSPPGESASAEDSLSWYKSQYEVLEQELAEFRESSKELEQELEKDIEQAEKRERGLQEKAESLAFEVEEWKAKCKQSKAEANAAQNLLEKEVTTLRDANRGLTMKLRDIEVANDDFERQARNTTSSLEDLESKYNVAIERGVLMEEEIKLADRERETLRIEAQRLREELSDLKIEAELLQDKIKKQEDRHLSHISTDMSLLESPTFDKTIDASPNSTASSPLITTPPDTAQLRASKALHSHDPPSPPMSDVSAPAPSARKPATKPVAKTPAPSTRKSRLPSADHSITLKPRSNFASSTTSRPVGRSVTATSATRTPAPRTTARAASHRIPASNSLTHIRSLTAQMQRLEARVQSARSKLPAPVNTPPRASPRSSVNGSSNVPATVTIRSRKRTIGSSSATSSIVGDEPTPTNPRNSTHSTSTTGSRHMSRPSASGISRLSFGPLPNRNPPGTDSDASISRPSSRASLSSYARPASRTEMIPPPRPMSRSSLSGARTPLGRPRSSIGMHGHSASISRIDMDEADEDAAAAGELRTPSRRGTYSRFDTDGGASNIPMPGRRQSGSGPSTRRTSSGVDLRASVRRSAVGAPESLEEETY